MPVVTIVVTTAETAGESAPKKSIRFRARSFVAFSLAPEAPLSEWLEHLDGWIANSPGFFAGRPVVLDLAALAPDEAALRGLVAALAARGIRVYAVEGAALPDAGPDLPPFLVGAKDAPVKEQAAKPEEAKAPEEAVAEEAAQNVAQDAAASEASPSEAGGDDADSPAIEPEPAAEATILPAAPGSMIIRTPVRSGQSIYQPQGDVIVLGSVGSGSEIIAGGSVHVYGTLRGRVFAGASGDQDARIFCQRNEAELLAVDGWYRTAESMEPASRGRAIQAFLENGVVQVAALV